MPSTCIVVKSYPKDYPWLAYCLRSIQKFCTGFSEVIVMIPREHPLPLTKETVVLMDAAESYLSQQVAKLNADLHTEADYIVLMDSDCIFTRKVTPDYFFYHGRPAWTVTPFSECSDTERKAWLHVMVKCVQKMPEHEFMRRNCIIVPRWIFPLFRKFIQDTHGMTMEQYVMSQPGHEFSEFNCLGFYAWLNHRDEFHWHDTSIDGIPKWPFQQRWSWGGLTPAIREEMEKVLA